MKRPCPWRLAVLIPLLLALAACSNGGLITGSGGQAADRTATGTEGLALAGVCPDRVVVQTTWFSQVEHFPAFQVLGKGYRHDPETKRVVGPLVAQGVDTGVDIEIRAGGPAVGRQPVTSLMYQDQSITLGMVPIDEAIQNSADQHVVAVMAPFELDPQVLLWSPEVYPQFNIIQDIGQTNVTVVYALPTGAYMAHLVGSGILKEKQIDSGYEGTPDRFVASGGKIVTQGFSTNEPYRWSRELPGVWNRPIEYAYVADTDYPNYRNTLAVRADKLRDLAPCLDRLVPIFQQATVEFINNPDPVISLVLEVVEKTKQGYQDSRKRSQHAVEVMRDDGLVSNGDDATLGEFDPARVARMLGILEPIIEGDVIGVEKKIFAGQGKPLKKGLEPGDVFTNEFIDEAIGLPAEPVK